MCLGRTARSRERRDHPRTNATMKQSRNTDSSVLINGGNTAIAFYVLDFDLRKENAGTLIACSLITHVEVQWNLVLSQVTKIDISRALKIDSYFSCFT